MKFWDSSAVIPLLVQEVGSGDREKQLRQDPAVVVWWGTPVECISALQRLVRSGALAPADQPMAEARLRQLEKGWTEVEPTQNVRRQAERLLRVHPLRAGDALQLAAALVACQQDPTGLAFCTADERLAEAAQREGFFVVR